MYWGRPGSVHTGIVTIDSLATSFRYPNEGSKVVGTIERDVAAGEEEVSQETKEAVR